MCTGPEASGGQNWLVLERGNGLELHYDLIMAYSYFNIKNLYLGFSEIDRMDDCLSCMEREMESHLEQRLPGGMTYISVEL